MPSVSDFLIERMENSGIRHVFGVPGCCVSGFFKKLTARQDMGIVYTVSEENAALAADAYARMRGIGCVCVSQKSILKIANSIACAKEERSPVVVISGAPCVKNRTYHQNIFDYLTCESVVLDNPSTAGYQIDAAFEKLKYHKQPVFIELLQDIADKPLVYDVYKQGTPTSPASDLGVLEEALQEVVDWIGGADSPVILAGVHIARYGLGTDLLKFAEKYNIPIVTTLLSKSVINEVHPLSKGVYIGAGSKPQVINIINESDCVITLGISPGGLDFAPVKQAIVCSSEILRVKNHHYANVGFEEFVRHLFKSPIHRDKLVVGMTNDRLSEFRPKNSTKITIARFFEKINSILNEDFAVISDAGDALMGASDLVVHHQNHFFATTSHPSMGFAIPAALGVQVAAPKVRPIVIVGDTAFQVSCIELSTIVDRRLNPIVFVLNNGGYSIDSINGPFHDIREWEYEKMTDVLNGGVGVVVEDEQALHSVVSVALKATQPYVVNVKIDASDISPALQRMRKEKSK